MPQMPQGMGQMPQQVALPTPEVRPSGDEQQVVWGPNLAENKDLCANLTRYVINDFWYPYCIQQQIFWEPWRRLYEAWCAGMEAIDLDLKIYDQGRKALDVATQPNQIDGFTLKVSPTEFHKQIDAQINMAMQMSFKDGLPVGGKKGDYVFEGAYDADQDSVDAFNEVLEDTARECSLESEYRKNFCSFALYGSAWALADLKRSFQDMDHRYPLDPMTGQQQMAQLMEKYQGQQPRFEQGPQGPIVIFRERQIKEFVTKFEHADIDAVFTDLTMPMTNGAIQDHPCPWLRKRVAENYLESRPYDPQLNPFGFLNIDTALHDAKGQYVFQQIDEGPIRERLEHRYGNTGQNQIKAKHMLKQLWTAWPMLRIDDQGNLDTGDGCPCGDCQGTQKVQAPLPQAPEEMQMGMEPQMQEIQCPTCDQGKVHPPLKRYVAQFYGGIYAGPMTCVRLQLMPDDEKMPLIFSAHLIEDTAGGIPVSKGEIVQNDNLLLAEYVNLELESARRSVRRGWFVYEDSPAFGKDFTKPDVQIQTSNQPGLEVQRMDSNSFDERLTIGPIIEGLRSNIENTMGVTNILQGQPFASGRRPMGEIGQAIDSAKTPIIIMVDAYNKQAMGEHGWAGFVRHNLNAYGDRDAIRKLTGKEYFGRLRFHTAMADEFMKKMSRGQSWSSLLQFLPPLAQISPGVAKLVPVALQHWFDDQGIDDVRVSDDGYDEATQQAKQIISLILGDGMQLPPMPDDPDDIYILVFSSCLRQAQLDTSSPWYQSPNLPLLQMRNQMQQQQAAFKLQQQQMMQQQQQAQQMDMQAQAQAKAKGMAPGKSPSRTPQHAGQAMQNAQGPQGAKSQG